jgi:hypothetical protein
LGGWGVGARRISHPEVLFFFLNFLLKIKLFQTYFWLKVGLLYVNFHNLPNAEKLRKFYIVGLANYGAKNWELLNFGQSYNQPS